MAMLENTAHARKNEVDRCLGELAFQGYSIIENAVPLELCEAILAEMDRMEDFWPRALNQSLHGINTIRYFDLLNADPIFQRVPVTPAILDVMRGVLGSDCLLGTYGTSSIGPGEQAQVIHTDDGMYGLERPHKEIYCLAVVALCDFTADNGGTRVLPFSHQFADYPPVQSKKLANTRFAQNGEALDRATIPAVMPKGCVCFVLGNTWHGGGANISDQPRPSMTVTYVAGWVRSQENHSMAVPQERAATFDPEIQALMGYGLNRRPLGHVYTADDNVSGPMVHRLRHSDRPPLSGPG